MSELNQDWISVEDHLPPHLMRVLAYYLDGRMYVGWWNGGPVVAGDIGQMGYQPSYWKYLPEPPDAV